MNKELSPLEAFNRFKLLVKPDTVSDECLELKEIIETELKRNIELEEENRLLRENNENLDENYYDTWYACERLKENSNYALMFIDDTYCLVDTKDNKFDVIDNYKINNYGVIDNDIQEKIKALEAIKKYFNIANLIAFLPQETQNRFKEEFDLLKRVML